jgi:hypothetical protein
MVYTRLAQDLCASRGAAIPEFARPDFRPVLIGLAALIGACPVTAWAGAPLAMPALAACDGQSEADLTVTPMTTADPAVTRLIAAIEQSFDAVLADNILNSVGDGRVMADGPAKPRPGRSIGSYIVKLAPGTPTPSLISALANPRFGTDDLMAVSIQPRLVPSGALNTDIRFSHRSDLLDAGFNLATQRSLITADSTAMRYDGRALVKFGSVLQLGMAARGTLGTLAAPSLTGQESAGPLFHLNLIDRNISLVTDMGYDFDLNPLNTVPRNQFHAKLDLKLKL